MHMNNDRVSKRFNNYAYQCVSIECWPGGGKCKVDKLRSEIAKPKNELRKKQDERKKL